MSYNSELQSNNVDLQAILDAVNALPEAGSSDPVLQEKTVTPNTSVQTVTPDSGYDGLSKVKVNAMPTATQATPSITVSSGGLITAKATQSAGYVAAGTKTSSKQLTVQPAKIIIPGVSDQIIYRDRYLTGELTIKGDTALLPGNIVKGVSIFGVEGTAEGGTLELLIIDAAGTERVIYTPPEGYAGFNTVEVHGDPNLIPENIVSGVSIFGVEGTAEAGGGAANELAQGLLVFDPDNFLGETFCFYNGMSFYEFIGSYFNVATLQDFDLRHFTVGDYVLKPPEYPVEDFVYNAGFYHQWDYSGNMSIYALFDLSTGECVTGDTVMYDGMPLHLVPYNP